MALTEEGAAFASSSNMSKAEMTQLLKSKMMNVTNSESELNEERKHGIFQPLGVWEKQGYDPVLIKVEARPGGIEYKTQLGLCYRLSSTQRNISRGGV